MARKTKITIAVPIKVLRAAGSSSRVSRVMRNTMIASDPRNTTS
jgi:hypothetical protein